jgi:hypothetical protein
MAAFDLEAFLQKNPTLPGSIAGSVGVSLPPGLGGLFSGPTVSPRVQPTRTEAPIPSGISRNTVILLVGAAVLVGAFLLLRK